MKSTQHQRRISIKLEDSVFGEMEMLESSSPVLVCGGNQKSREGEGVDIRWRRRGWRRRGWRSCDMK